MPFKAHAAGRHHIPKQRYRVTNWRAYDASLRQRGSLTVWFTKEAIAAWRAEPAAHDPGRAALVLAPGDPDGADPAHHVPPGAAPDRRADRLHPPPLLGLDLAVPDHTTLSRRAATLRVPRPRAGTGPLQLLVDSTGLRLGGPGEWLTGKHGAKTRRSWRKLHLGVDAGTGRIEAVELTGNETDDGSRVGPLLDQVAAPVASFTGDGAYDREDVSGVVAERHPAAAVVVPPRKDAVPSATAATAPTQRDRHLRLIAERGRLGWQKASGYHRRALAEVAISRYKRVIGDTLRSRTDGHQATEVTMAVHALNRMLELGRPESVRIA